MARLTFALWMAAAALAQAQLYFVPKGTLGSASIGHAMGRSLSESIQSAQQGRLAQENLTAGIQNARQAFWAAYPNGKGIEAARQEYARQLWLKDFSIMTMLLPTGPDSKEARFIWAAIGQVDGGIPSSAVSDFNAWVGRVRAELPQMAGVAMPTANALLPAMEKHQKLYDLYVRKRDFAEFCAAGRETELFPTPEEWLAHHLRINGNGGGSNQELPDEKINEVHRQLVGIFGEKGVKSASEKLRRAPMSNEFRVKNAEPLGFHKDYTYVPNLFPRLAAGEDDALYLVAMRGSNYSDQLHWEEARKDTDAYLEKFGKDKVLKTVRFIRKAPKDDRGRMVSGPLQNMPEWYAFEKVMQDAERQGALPAYVD